MVEQKLTVSRKQCVVRCRDDATAFLTSFGRGPTLFRGHSSRGLWVALQAGEGLPLAEADQISEAAAACSWPQTALSLAASSLQL